MVMFNQTSQLGNALPLCAAGLPKGLSIRNARLELVERLYPELRPLTQALLSMVESKKYLSVSVYNQSFNDDKATCVDAGWHIDGRLNPDNPDQYALICFGEDGTRTMFHNQPREASLPAVPLQTLEARRAYFTEVLESSLDDESIGFEVPNATPIAYTTFDFHKGRVAPAGSSRLFIRLLSSDLIRPEPDRRILRAAA
jgi:hypothetical protein